MYTTTNTETARRLGIDLDAPPEDDIVKELDEARDTWARVGACIVPLDELERTREVRQARDDLRRDVFYWPGDLPPLPDAYYEAKLQAALLARESDRPVEEWVNRPHTRVLPILEVQHRQPNDVDPFTLTIARAGTSIVDVDDRRDADPEYGPPVSEALQERMAEFVADRTQIQQLTLRARYWEGASIRDTSRLLGSATEGTRAGSAQSNETQAIYKLRRALLEKFADGEPYPDPALRAKKWEQAAGPAPVPLHSGMEGYGDGRTQDHPRRPTFYDGTTAKRPHGAEATHLRTSHEPARLPALRGGPLESNTGAKSGKVRKRPCPKGPRATPEREYQNKRRAWGNEQHMERWCRELKLHVEDWRPRPREGWPQYQFRRWDRAIRTWGSWESPAKESGAPFGLEPRADGSGGWRELTQTVLDFPPNLQQIADIMRREPKATGRGAGLSGVSPAVRKVWAGLVADGSPRR